MNLHYIENIQLFKHSHVRFRSLQIYQKNRGNGVSKVDLSVQLLILNIKHMYIIRCIEIL